MKKPFLIFFLFCMGASFFVCARQNNYYSDAVLDELRLELSDVKHELHSARVEINLLEEKLAKQEKSISFGKQQEGTLHKEKTLFSAQLDALEKKIDRLEKTLDKALIDVRNLNASENKSIAKIEEIESAIQRQEKRFDEIGKLKSTLTTISKAIGQSVKTAHTASQSYQVKSGDSLEKIARAHCMTVEQIKQLNQLSHDKIIIGQELKVQAHDIK